MLLSNALKLCNISLPSLTVHGESYDEKKKMGRGQILAPAVAALYELTIALPTLDFQTTP